MRTSVGWLAGVLAEDGHSQDVAALGEHALFDHLVSAAQYRLPHGQPKRLGRIEVNGQLERLWSLYR